MGNNKIKISLIIPVYNVEKYLFKALSSVENQSFDKSNFEVIIIDDGSRDSSVDIIKEFCERNINFKFLSQENSGPAIARNTALKIAQGEYIAFLDSDDYLEKNYLEKLYGTAKENNADIVCCNYYTYYPEKDIKINLPFNAVPGVCDTKKALRKLILDFGTHYFVWNKLIKREIFTQNKILFEDMYFEDISICPKLFFYAQKVVFIEDNLYNYTSRDTSILHSMNVTKINDYIRALGNIRNFMESQNIYQEYKNYLWVYAQKAKIVCYYYILNLHIKASNHRGIFENINSATKSIDYFVGNEFKSKTENMLIQIPYSIVQPQNLSKIKVEQER